LFLCFLYISLSPPPGASPQVVPPRAGAAGLRAFRDISKPVGMNIPVDPFGSRPSQSVGLSLLQVPLAAHSPAGLPDRCAADPTHPAAQSAHRAGTSPARFPIPRPWHRARPTCARRHVRSTFNLSTCRCASFCTWATGPVHGPIGWACFLGCQPFVGEMTSKSVRQPRMRHHGKAAQPMVRRGHGLPAGAPGAP